MNVLVCSKKKRAGSTLEILEVWGWAAWLASIYLIWKRDGGKSQIFLFWEFVMLQTDLQRSG